MSVDNCEWSVQGLAQQLETVTAQRDELAGLLAEWKTYYGSCEREHCHSCLTHITAAALDAL